MLSDSLLGQPLATPERRGVAILVDLLVVALLAQLGGILLGLVGAAFLFRAALKRKGNGDRVLNRAFRGATGCVGAVVLFITITVAWGWMGRLLDPPAERADRVAAGSGATVLTPGFRDFLQGAQEARAFRGAESEAEARELAGRLAERLRSAGVPEQDVREVLRELAPSGSGWVGSIEEWNLAAGADAGPAGEPRGADAELAQQPGWVADSIRGLEERLEREEAERLRAERALQQSQEQLGRRRGIRAFLRGAAEDLGLGLGWGALYFSILLSWWNGRTVGKRLLGLRVVRLDGRPISWWNAFERYGGYAAGFATGLLGFIQVYWDPNRQATHDKVASTVVLREGRRPASSSAPDPRGP